MRSTFSPFEQRTMNPIDNRPRSIIPEVLGVILTAAALSAFGDVLGLLAALMVVGTWILLPTEYAFAFGHVSVVTVTSVVGGGELFVGVESGLVLLLAGAIYDGGTGIVGLLAWTLLYAMVMIAVWILLVGNVLTAWQVAVLLVVLCGGATYLLHRHQQIVLGTGAEAVP